MNHSTFSTQTATRLNAINLSLNIYKNNIMSLE